MLRLGTAVMLGRLLLEPVRDRGVHLRTTTFAILTAFEAFGRCGGSDQRDSQLRSTIATTLVALGAQPVGRIQDSRQRRWRALLVLVLMVVALARGAEARAGDTLIAVATNFAEVMPALEEEFEHRSGHELRYTTGSTGQLYAQIRQRGPFDAFLAADTERPARLVDEGRAVADSRFTYARGRLVLWSRDAGRIGSDGARTLREAPPRKLVIANPELAPYGAAAREVMENLGVWEDLQSRVVTAQNVGQAHAMVHMAAAEMGFVAASAIVAKGDSVAGSQWRVPTELHEPIRQDAVLLNRAADNVAARAFLDFLASAAGRAIIADHGYDGE